MSSCIANSGQAWHIWNKKRGLSGVWLSCPGGGALAEKLVETYFTLFKLILEGKLGHAGQLAAAKEDKGSTYHGKNGKAGGKAGSKGSNRKSSRLIDKVPRAPSSIDQVMHLSCCFLCLPDKSWTHSCAWCLSPGSS